MQNRDETNCRGLLLVPRAGLVVALLGLLGLILIGSRLVRADIRPEKVTNYAIDPASSLDRSRFDLPASPPSELLSATMTYTAYAPIIFAERPSTRGMIAFERHATGDEPYDIWMMYQDGTRQVNLTKSPGRTDGAPSWSPDGKYLAFSSAPMAPENSNHAIYKMDVLSRAAVPLTSGAHDDTWPAWSPNGDKIAFMRRVGGSPPDIYVMNVDGTGQTQLTDWTYGDDFPTWSPDGTMIAFSSDRQYAGRDLYVMRSDGANQRLLLLTPSQDELYPTWGRDGWIYYTFQVQKKPQKQEWLYRIDPDTSYNEKLFNDEYNRYIVSWAPDGQCFVFYSTMGGIAGTDKEVWKWCRGFTDPINLTNNSIADEFSAWSPAP
jgi:Tol biopolymer transport system component